MKREAVKFKAKRIADGKWIQGNLTDSVIGAEERTNIQEILRDDLSNRIIGIKLHEVHPETVCMFTGRIAKDGKMIFVGDKVVVRGTARVGQYETVVIWRMFGAILKTNHTNLIDSTSLLSVEKVIGNMFGT